tara:strand:+ start:539 stop:1063 length:525 start_codon:yes stop_codon:yes gene_type:complete
MKLLNYSNLKIIFTVFIVIASMRIHAQENYKKNITKATLLSTACPGLGQAYNKKYWKIPIIYSSMGATIYYYTQNNKQYQHYKSEYQSEIDDDPNTINSSGHNSSNLITLQDYYRDRRDLSAFFLILLYSLNIVDACVDAHLMNYNVNDNLSLYLKPSNSIDHESISLCLKFNL